MMPNQELKVPFPVSMSIDYQGEGRYRLSLNDSVFNYYEGETLKIEANKKYLTIGLK